MYRLISDDYNLEYEQVKARLDSLTLAYHTEFKEWNEGVILVDGKQKWCGLQDIMQHLDDVERELKHWHYAAC
jgi:hypothetical protein